MTGFAIKVGADTKPFEQGMKAALTVAGQTAAQIGARYAVAATGIDKAFSATARNLGVTFGRELMSAVSPAALGIAAGVAGLVAMQFAIKEVGEAARAAEERLAGMVKIAADARGAGVGTTFLQSLTGQAKTLGTEVSTLTGMLERARDASTVSIGEGTGKASSPILDRLRQNVKAGNLGTVDLERFTNADSQEARIKVVLDLIDQLRAKGADLAALDLGGKFFGAEFETKLRTGVDMVGAMRRALDGLSVGDQGRIIPPEEVQRAENLNRRLEEAQRILQDGLAPINRDIAMWQSQQLAGWVDIKEQIAAAAGFAGRLYESTAAIGRALSALGNANVFQSMRNAMDSMGLIDKGEVARIERQLNGGLEATDKPGAPKDADAGGPLRISVKPKGDTSRALPSLTPHKASAAPSSSEITAIESFVGNLEKSAAALKAEADAYGKSSVERRISIELAKAEEIAKQNNTKLTDEQTARIRASATALAEQREKLDDLREAQDNLRSGAKEVFGGIYHDIRNGVSALQILENALGRVLDRIANNQIDSLVDSLFGKPGSSGSLSSAFSNIIGSALGGGGGTVAPGAAIANAPMPPARPAGFATGVTAIGEITGPGTETSDSILAQVLSPKPKLIRVSKGESIVNAKATRENRGLIQALNAGTIKGYAGGGTLDDVAANMGSALNSVGNADTRAARNAGATTEPGIKVEVVNKGTPQKVESAAVETDGRGQRRLVMQMGDIVAAGSRTPQGQSALQGKRTIKR